MAVSQNTGISPRDMDIWDLYGIYCDSSLTSKKYNRFVQKGEDSHGLKLGK